MARRHLCPVVLLPVVAAVFCYVVASAAFAADITGTRDSNNFNFKYTGADLASSVEWSGTPDDTKPTATVEGNYLRFDVADNGMFTWLDALSNIDGWTVEISLQVTQPGAEAFPSAFSGIVADGQQGQYNVLNIGAGAVYAGQTSDIDTVLVEKDMTDSFHKIRIAQAPYSGLGDTHVWVDGELVSKELKGLGSHAYTRNWWGRSTGAQTQGQSLIDYIRVDTSGGYGPDGWVYIPPDPPDPLPEKDSATFDWKYEMDVDPTTQDLDANAINDFSIGGPDTASVSGGVMTYTSGFETGVWCASSHGSGGIWQGKTSIEDGYTVEARVKILNNPESDVAFGIFATPSDNDGVGYLTVGANGQGWGGSGEDGNNLALGEVDNTDDFHVFRLVQHPGEDIYSVWRDDVKIAEGINRGYSSAQDAMWILDGSGYWGGQAEVDYVRFMSGAYAPDSSEYFAGDANRDHVVDAEDAAILASNWLSSGADWGMGDFNNDGMVDDIDATLLASNWNSTAASNSVPEPGVLAIALGLLLSLACVRRLR